MGSVCFLDERWGLYLPWSSLRNGYIIQWRFKGRSMPSLIYRKDLTLHHKIKSSGLLPMIRECFKLLFTLFPIVPMLLSQSLQRPQYSSCMTFIPLSLCCFYLTHLWRSLCFGGCVNLVNSGSSLPFNVHFMPFFWDRGLLCIPGSSGTHHVDQADYRDLLISGLLSGGIKGMLNIPDQCLWSYLPRPFAM